MTLLAGNGAAHRNAGLREPTRPLPLPYSGVPRAPTYRRGQDRLPPPTAGPQELNWVPTWERCPQPDPLAASNPIKETSFSMEPGGQQGELSARASGRAARLDEMTVHSTNPLSPRRDGSVLALQTQ